jgi:hypothetical protein
MRMRLRLTSAYRPLLIVACTAAGCVVIAVSAIGSSAAITEHGNAAFALSAKLEGRPIGADRNGRGTAFLRLDPSKREVCYAVHAEGVEKGRAFIGDGAKGVHGHSVLTLFGPGAKSRGLTGCIRYVSRRLMTDIGAHPGQFYVAVANHQFPRAAIRGQLRRSRALHASYSATDCYIYVYDDTGEGHDFATGQSTTPTPIDGTGVRYLAGEDHSKTTCIVSRTYTFPKGTVKVYAKDRLIGSNVYSCTTTGIYKCFGPRDGSTLKGWTLRVVYYVCIPGASQRPSYCPR